jgi:hypothetical protein
MQERVAAGTTHWHANGLRSSAVTPPPTSPLSAKHIAAALFDARLLLRAMAACFSCGWVYFVTILPFVQHLLVYFFSPMRITNNLIRRTQGRWHKTNSSVTHHESHATKKSHDPTPRPPTAMVKDYTSQGECARNARQEAPNLLHSLLVLRLYRLHQITPQKPERASARTHAPSLVTTLVSP